MSETRAGYDEGFKKNSVKLSKASPKTVKHVSEDLGIGKNLQYICFANAPFERHCNPS